MGRTKKSTKYRMASAFGELQRFLTVECYNGKIIEKAMAKNDGLRLDEQKLEFAK
jgi:hypothetical protein